jgi:hypothetical protein
VVELPDWLAGWLRDVNRHLPALGRERRQALNHAALETRRRVLSLPVGEAEQGLMAAWVQGELDVVAEANRVGGWNLAIYQCTLNLLEGGWDKDVVEMAVLKAAAPVSNLESRNAAYTIESAYRRHLYKVAEGEA